MKRWLRIRLPQWFLWKGFKELKRPRFEADPKLLARQEAARAELVKAGKAVDLSNQFHTGTPRLYFGGPGATKKAPIEPV